MMRGVWALVVAAFPAALFQAAMVAIWPKEGSGVFEHPASTFVAICLYFYISGLIVGLPAFQLLRRRYTDERRIFAYAGLATGVIPVGVALAWEFLNGRSSADVIIYDLVFFGLGGLAAGLIYWWARYRGSAVATADPANA